MSTIKSKENATYSVNGNDLIPLVNNLGDTPQSVTPNQIANAINGSNIIIVGDTGQFLTIAEALIYLATQPGIVQITTTAICDFTQWDNFAPLISGDFGEAQVGDWVYLINDDPAIDTLQYDWHYYRLLSVNDGAGAESNLGLHMESGVLGPSKVGSTVSIFRMPSYTLKLLPGIHDTTSAVMPDGYDVTFEGCGRSTIVIGQGIAVPIYARMDFSNFILQGSVSTPDDRTANGIVVQDAGFAAYEWRDMWVEGDAATMGNSQSGQSQRITNVKCRGMKGHRIYVLLFCDFLEVDNFNVDLITAMEIAEIFSHWRRVVSSHLKIIKNSSFKRHQDQSAQIDHNSLFSMDTMPREDNHPTFRLDFINCCIEDNGLNVSVENDHVVGFANHDTATRKSIIRFIDTEINNIGSHNFAVGPKPATSSDNGLNIEFIRSHDIDDLQIVHDFPDFGAATLIFRDKGDQTPFPWTAFISLNASTYAENVIISPMTADTSFLNPSNPLRGDELRIHLEQGGTAGYTVSWASATNMKVHTNPSGVGTSIGDKIVFDFYYDGTHWVQMNSPAWA